MNNTLFDTYMCVILSETKDLEDSKAVGDSTNVITSREILHCVQNDIVERDVQNDVVERGVQNDILEQNDANDTVE